MSMSEVIKQSCVKKFVNCFTVVGEDHFEELTNARLYHGRVNWVISLNKDSVNWEKQILEHY